MILKRIFKYYFFILFLLSISSRQGFSQNIITKVISNSQINLNITDTVPKYSEQKIGGSIIRDYYQYTDYSKPGQFKLPYINLIIALPPNSHPNFTLEKSEKNLAKNSVPALNPKLKILADSTVVEEKTKYSPKQIRIQNVEPDFVVESYFWYRDFYCASIRINNYNYDQKSNSIAWYNKLKLNINFKKAYNFSENSPIKILSKYDKIFRNIIADYNIAGQFRSSKINLINSDSLTNWINYNATYIKLAVGKDGLYRISKNYLEQYGINTSLIDPTTFQIYNYGREIPIYVSGESDNTFDQGDFIEFWGTRNYPSISYRKINQPDQPYNEFLNRYTDTSYYFLTWGVKNGLRVTELKNALSLPADTLKYYTEFDHYEDNTMFQNMSDNEIANQTPNWDGNKTWYWQWIITGTRKYNFSVVNRYPNKQANIYIKYVSGGSNIPTNSHNIILKYNNTLLDSQIVNRFAQVILQGRVSSNSISNGNNQIAVTNYNNGNSPNFLGLDWYDVEYPRQLSLVNDSLIFAYKDSSAVGFKTIRIDNVDSINYSLYRTRPGLKKIENFKIQNRTIYFADTIFYNSQYCVVVPSKILSPVFEYKKKFTNLADASNQADYIAITHPKFWSAVQNYVAQISNLYGANTKQISVKDIYDLYGYGYPTPESIKLFIMNAMQNWKEPKPAYLTLIGDADYDYKGYILKNVGVRVGENYVPSYGDPVGDDWYVIFDNNFTIPQLKVGRIPINNPNELNFYLTKIKANQNQAYTDWNKRYLFFSGGGQSSEYQEFKSVNDSVISQLIIPRPIAGDYSSFYKTQSPQTDFGPYTNQQVQTAIDNGGIFISYLGHSGTATWDNSINNVSQLKNSVGRYPLITDFGCSTNKFAEPDIVCFGERFLLDNNGEAVGYIGNSSLGFTSTATTVPLEFYNELLSDSLREVGNAHLMAKIKLFNYFGNSGINKIFAYANALLGDPAIRLKVPDKPNLLLNNSSFIFPDNAINENIDSIKVGVIIENDGLAPIDSVSIDIKHELATGKVIDHYNLSRLIPAFKDTVYIWLKTKFLSGQHILTVNIDPDNKIDEIYKNDNLYTDKFFVYSASLRDLVENTIDNSQIDSLYILNPSESSSTKFNIKLQLSQDNNFVSPKEYTFSADSFFTIFKFSSLLPGQRYWYRYKIDSINTEYSSSKSFLNLAGGDYFLNDSISFKNQKLVNLKPSFNGLKLSNDALKISVLSAGWYAGATCVIDKNGTNQLSNSFFAGMGIVVFDAKTLKVDTTSWYTLFGQPGNVQALADLINSIPNGKIVAMGVADDGRNNLSTALKSAIKTLGSTKIDSLQFRGSWAIIGKKGASPGDVLEKVKGPYDGSVLIDSTFKVPNTQGEFTTNVIGPSVKWKTVKIGETTSNGSKISYSLFGIKSNGSTDSLGSISLPDSVASLNQINAKKYPKIKISGNFSAASDGTSPELKLLSVDYDLPPELGLNYQTVTMPSDTIYQGNDAELNYSITNASETAADSFKVKVYLNLHNKSNKLLFDTLITKLAPRKRLHLSLNYKTNYTDAFGNMTFAINVDPENNVTELYKDNNYYSKSFYVVKDTITYVKTASLNITFDGNKIYDGDYVSPKPLIAFNLNYGTLYPFRDTTSLSFNLDGQRIYFSEMDSIAYDTINRQVKYTFRPHLKDGEHTISISGTNLDNQPQDLEKTFYVSNELKVLNLYNYPNPFNTYTYFTFNLTKIPDAMKIKIYTVAGRLIKVINVPVSELRNNFNKIYWDGHDEDGDLVANGVYLYKVITKLSNKTYSDIQKLAVVR